MQPVSNEVLATKIGAVRDDLHEIKTQLTQISARWDGLEGRLRHLERAEARMGTVIAILATVGTVIGGMAATALFRGLGS